MSPIDALRVAFRAIAANGLRSFLTTLGMVIGVGSVIVLIAVGQGAQKGVQDQIRGLGTDLVFIKPAAEGGRQNGGARGAAGSGQTLTKADSDAISAANIPGIKGVASQISINVQAITPANNQNVTVIATDPSYPGVRGVAIASGQFITDTDVERKALTIVLGPDIAKTLFPDSDPIGQTVRLSIGDRINLNFKVAGVMAPKGGSQGGAQDAYVYAGLHPEPHRVVRNATGQINVNQINVQTLPGANQSAVMAAITNFLATRHEVSTPDFTVQSQDDLVGAAGQVSRTLSILLGSIAGISLVVGAIGVMNIMLVSVTERTREIGIRRAVGARAKDIVLQFVTEALALCVGGGLLGIIIGIGVAIGIDGRDIAGSTMSTLVQPWSVVVAFAVSAGIGAASGSYPAFRASRLDPITALRTD
ncbi:MAG: ABC transporter permease [Dehalococcoidia bacterium]|nr:ABC transporter permease [Dehalococcoidia bacterium]